MKIDLSKMEDGDLAQLIDNRWTSSQTLWEIVTKTYASNTAVYENKSEWLKMLPHRRKNYSVQANRVFVNMEAVINSLIANPASINVVPARDGDEAADYARKIEKFMKKKIQDRNFKETMRMGLRNLYFGRLIVIKPFWNTTIDDFDFKAIDPRMVRFSKFARKEQDTEFAAEEIEDNLCSVIAKFPTKAEDLKKKYGIVKDEDLYIKNPDVKYTEAWIQDYVVFKLGNIILGKIKNPYWDFDGVLITEDEEARLNKATDQDSRRNILQGAKMEYQQRKAESVPVAAPQIENEEAPTGVPEEGAEMTAAPTAEKYKPYYFNYFDAPRKPYIFATIFNNENSPIGRTDMITLSAELQRNIDKRKMDIDENCELANGVLKIDSSVMDKADAQRIRFETKGIIWGNGVKDGVTRETGQALPQMVFDDMIDSRSEIDNIMAASSAFRGERQGQETKAGRLALIQQSFLRLNELVQVVDYVSKESFEWAMQLAKTRYTEYHYAKWMGKEGAREVMEIIQDDFETGSEVSVTAGKSLPVDNEFRYEQAQNDVEKGFISPVDYLEIAQYDNAKELAKNAVAFKINPTVAVGLTAKELAEIQPPENTEDKPPNVSINYGDLPPDAQVQLLAKIGIQADPQVMLAEKMAVNRKADEAAKAKMQPPVAQVAA